jgi:hypothetical protein
MASPQYRVVCFLLKSFIFLVVVTISHSQFVLKLDRVANVEMLVTHNGHLCVC